MFFYREADSSSIESPGAYLLDCEEVLLLSSRGEGPCLVDELLSMFYRVDFDIFHFPGVCKSWNYSFQVISKGSNGDVMNAGFGQEVIGLEKVGERVIQYCTKRK